MNSNDEHTERDLTDDDTDDEAAAMRRRRRDLSGFGVLRALTYSEAQWQELNQEKRDGRRCRYCGVPVGPETRTADGRCRFCGDGEEVPF